MPCIQPTTKYCELSVYRPRYIQNLITSSHTPPPPAASLGHTRSSLSRLLHHLPTHHSAPTLTPDHCVTTMADRWLLQKCKSEHVAPLSPALQWSPISVRGKPSVLRGQPSAGGCGEVSRGLGGLAAEGFVSNLRICSGPSSHPCLREKQLDNPKHRSSERKEIYYFQPRRHFSRNLISVRGDMFWLVVPSGDSRGVPCCVCMCIRGCPAAHKCHEEGTSLRGWCPREGVPEVHTWATSTVSLG